MSPEETSNMISLINRLTRELGLTILFCEHDMDLVFAIAGDIMVMQQGVTIIQGHPEDIRSNALVQEAYLGGAD
jgi:branched-chain amino acid transport system ATP-binding protein